MKLYAINGEFWWFDLSRWALPINIEANRYYSFNSNNVGDIIENGGLYSIEFKFALLCFHIEFWLQIKNDEKQNDC